MHPCSAVKWLLGIVVTGLSVAASAAEPLPTTGRFLIANESIKDPRFSKTVILMVDYEPKGALGIIVNRPLSVTLHRAFPETEWSTDSPGHMWYGGPVTPDRAAVLLRTNDELKYSQTVLTGLKFSAHNDAFAMANKMSDASHFRIYAGYAGWGPGQLDNEMKRGDWRVVPATIDAVFTPEPTKLWRQLSGNDGTWVQTGPLRLATGRAPGSEARLTLRPQPAS